jgi:hypothetical protein
MTVTAPLCVTAAHWRQFTNFSNGSRVTSADKTASLNNPWSHIILVTGDGKGKVVPVLFFNWAPRPEGVLAEWRYSSTHSLTSALDGGEWSASRPSRFTPKETAPGTHWIGGWVGPRAVLNSVVKRKIPSPRRESNPKTPIVQPVAQRYTDWAITAQWQEYIW